MECSTGKDAARRKFGVCAMFAEPADLRYFARAWSASAILAYPAELILARMLKLGFVPVPLAAFPTGCGKLEATGTQIARRRGNQKNKRGMLSTRE
jgi:hypothetical protein